MNDIKRMPIAEFRERGYLHEINRLFLHPLGLALEVVVAPSGHETLGAVWDHRDDAEGIYYGEDLLSPEKAARVCSELLERRGERQRILGYVNQPIPDARVLTVNYLDPERETLADDNVEFER